MIHVLLRVVCILALFLSVSAAPHRASRWDEWRAYRGRGNGTRPSRCSRQSVFPSAPSTIVSFSTEPSSPSVPVPDPASTSVSETLTPTSDSILTTTSTAAVESTVSSEPNSPPSSVISTSTAAASPSATSDSDIQAWLDGHNTLRQQHGASDLTWSDTLASYAQSYANGCVFEHSGGQYGENLYAGTGNNVPVSDATSAWGSEASQYNPSNPTYSHFTQMVWKATAELGCAKALCDGIFDASYGKATYYVCEYNPPGNVIGQFDSNVQA